jgi:hypothetical protein
MSLDSPAFDWVLAASEPSVTGGVESFSSSLVRATPHTCVDLGVAADVSPVQRGSSGSSKSMRSS